MIANNANNGHLSRERDSFFGEGAQDILSHYT
jgi:hypothetical protein